MSVPPQLIRVKRKATEEAPVSYLRVQETKRHRSHVFVYQRQDEEVAFAESIPRQIQKPLIHTTPASRQSTASQNATRQNTDANKGVSADKANNNDDASKAASSRATAASTNTLDSAPISEPRRFHMSRKDMLLAASPYPDRSYGHGGISKKRPATAMFVERNIKRVSPRVLDKLHAAGNAPAPATQAMEVDKPELRKFKKPGVARRTAARDNKAKDKPQLPKSMTDRWNVDMQQLTADMEAYALQQIGLNLQRAEEERREQEKPRTKTSTPLKFKPKPPAKRYAERHPEEVQPPVDKEMADADVETSESDSEYIIETYVRVPASSMGDHVPPQSVGLLVFDAEPDVEFFYGEDDESEDEWAEDEEDENAENYYTADYPDEEVASDDEFGKNPYAFRTGNASDLEEYDMGAASDDQFNEEGIMSQFRTHIGQNGARSNHL
ncbi:hypothetical protein F4803DRAFT_79529 [Xylaria telfairii]|nr:hypothetical protein F4803DRAFT_79529 [Xylaria telfairii]